MNEWMKRIEQAAKLGGALAKLISELMDAVAKGDARRVDEILSEEFDTTVSLKLSRLEFLRALDDREREG